MNIIKIPLGSNINDYPDLELFFNLTDSFLRDSYESANGIFIVESFKVLKVALQNGIESIALLIEENRLEALQELKELLSVDAPIYVMERGDIEKVAGYRVNRGVLCACKRFAPLTVTQVLQDSHRVAVLEDITNTTNIGAIFRSAAALGIDGILLSPRCADALCRRAVRVSMGSVFLIPWTYMSADSGCNNWYADSVDILKKAEFTCAACALSDSAIELGSHETNCLKVIDKLAMFFGTEGEGLSSRIIDACDYVVKIPMYNDVDSLNVAAASAVFFWELCLL